MSVSLMVVSEQGICLHKHPPATQLACLILLMVPAADEIRLLLTNRATVT